MTQQLERYLGDLVPEDLATKRSPRIAAQYIRVINSICGANPYQFGAVIPHLMRVIQEYQLGSNKTIPVQLKDINSGVTCLPTNDCPPNITYQDAFVKQCRQLYNFMARKLDVAFRTALRPYLINGTGQRTVQAIEGDIVVVSFILLDMHEASSWQARRQMHVYFTNAANKIQTALNVRSTLESLQQAMSEALRLKVKLEYDVVIAVSTSLRKRSPDFTEVAGRYINKSQDELRAMNLESNALGQLDLLIAEALEVCRKCAIEEVAATVNQIDTYNFDHAAEKLDTMNPEIGITFAIRDENSKPVQTQSLPCCIKDCDKSVPPFLSRILTKQAPKKKGDLAQHEGLCTEHHKQLNIEKTVSELPMQKGGVRKPNVPKGARAVNQVSVTQQSIKEMMMNTATELGWINPADAATKKAPAITFSALAESSAKVSDGTAKESINIDEVKEFMRSNPQMADQIMASMDVSAVRKFDSG